MGTEHEMVFRFPAATAQATIVSELTTFANAVKNLMPTADSFLALRHQDAGSTVSFPLGWTAIAGTYASSMEVDDEAKFIAISGRSLAGYRCRLTYFTPVPFDTSGYRLPFSGAGALAGFLTAAQAISPALRAVDGVAVIWNQYINIGYNSYWQRQLR